MASHQSAANSENPYKDLEDGADQEIRDVVVENDLFCNAIISKNFKRLEDILTKLQVNSLDINQKIKDGKTALHIAIDERNLYATKLLMSRGADVQLKAANGDNCLHLAVNTNSVNFVDLFLPEFDANERNGDGFAALHWAAIFDKETLTEKLVYAGADVNAQDNKGDTPLHVAIEEINLRLINTMLTFGADPNLKNKEGFSPFIESFHWFIDTAMLELFLSFGADLKVKNDFGDSALHLCVSIKDHYDKLEIARLLLSLGVDVNERNNEGKSALHLVFDSSDYSDEELSRFVKLLVEHGADSNLEDVYGEAPMSLAVKSNKQTLLEAVHRR